MRKLFVLLALVVLVAAVPAYAQGAHADTALAAKCQLASPGIIRGFDPQPDPPAAIITNPGIIRGFDPQPDPPAVRFGAAIQLCDGSV